MTKWLLLKDNLRHRENEFCLFYFVYKYIACTGLAGLSNSGYHNLYVDKLGRGGGGGGG